MPILVGMIHSWAEELSHMFRLTICNEQIIRLDCGLREFLRPLLFPFSFVNDSDVGSIACCR